MGTGNVEGFKTVEWWLGRLSPATRKMARYNLSYFMQWLNAGTSPFSKMNPDELVAFQKAATTAQQYDILDQVQTWVMSKEGRLGYKQTRFNHVKSFFMHNRAALPRDPSFNLRGDKPRIVGVLSPDDVRKVVLRSNRMYRAVFLSMLAGGMGQEEAIYWSNTGYTSLRDQLRREVDLIRVDLPGRKALKNSAPYYTLLGGDALQAIREYLPTRPKGGEAIFLNAFGEPLQKSALYAEWRRQVLNLGLGEKGTRERRVWSGRHTHEIRDVYRTSWAKSGAAPQIGEFLMGHAGDPLNYDKSMRDEAFVRKEYRRALPYLNVLNSPTAHGLVPEERITELEARVDKLTSAIKLVYDNPEIVEKIKRGEI